MSNNSLPQLQDTIPIPRQPPFIHRPAFDQQPSILAVAPAAARTTGGKVVTITGAKFTNAPDGSAPVVTFGGVAATGVTVVSPNTITCTVPAFDGDAGPVDVTVTIGTLTATAQGLFTYFEGTITKITPAYGPINGGTQVVIEGYNFLEGTVVFFDDSQATDIIFVSSQKILCKTPNHATGFVDVTLVEPLIP